MEDSQHSKGTLSLFLFSVLVIRDDGGLDCVLALVKVILYILIGLLINELIVLLFFVIFAVTQICLFSFSFFRTRILLFEKKETTQ